MNTASPGPEPALDAEGHLVDLNDWTPELARRMAALDNLTLDERHFAVLNAARSFYTRYQRAPATRPLLKHLGQTLGPDYADSIRLMQLFGTGSVARTVARLAGLPKPPNCL